MSTAAVRVITSSRLHFGLLSLSATDLWPDRHGDQTLVARRFGGVGLMTTTPGLSLTVTPADQWSAVGPRANRALAFAKQVATAVPTAAVRPLRVAIDSAPDEHQGLGTGTQLGLAVAYAANTVWGLPGVSVIEHARRVGRGERSALGIHGFAQGGFLVEGGKTRTGSLSPLVARHDFPAPWRIVLITPNEQPGIHGAAERAAFQAIMHRGLELTTTDALARLVVLGLLPALVDRDVEGFGEALHDFNARSGAIFAAAQGGIYAGIRAAEIVRIVRAEGIRGVGQSSWGPTLFAVVGDPDRADHLCRRLRQAHGLSETQVVSTTAANHGAKIALTAP